MSFLSRRFTAVCLMGAAFVTLAGMLVTPWEEEATTASYLQAYVGHETQGQIAAVLLHFGYLLFVPAVFGLINALGDRRGKLSTVAGVLAVIGWVTLPGMLVVDFYALALVDNLTLEQAVAIEDAAASMAGAAVIGITGAIPAFLGLFLLFIAVARARLVSFAVPVLFFAGTVLGFAQIGPAMIAGSALLVVTCGLTAYGLLGGRAPRAAPSLAPATA